MGAPKKRLSKPKRPDSAARRRRPPPSPAGDVSTEDDPQDTGRRRLHRRCPPRHRPDSLHPAKAMPNRTTTAQAGGGGVVYADTWGPKAVSRSQSTPGTQRGAPNHSRSQSAPIAPLGEDDPHRHRPGTSPPKMTPTSTGRRRLRTTTAQAGGGGGRLRRHLGPKNRLSKSKHTGDPARRTQRLSKPKRPDSAARRR